MATNPIDTASEFITQLYIGYFNRAPDPDGLNYWIGRYNAGMSLVDIANSFAAQSEATSTYGYLAAPNVGSQSSFIQSVYQNLFGRSAEATGLAYWTAQLTSAGAGNEGRVILDMISGASTANGDRQRIENKVEVGVYYAEQYVNNNLTWSTADIGEAQSAVASITFDTATVTSGKTAVDTVVINNVASNGCSISLTTATDTITGTTKNDTISAIVGGDNQTFNTALDSINGAAGTDTVALTIAATAAGSASITTTGIEVVNVRAQNATGTFNLSLAGVAGHSAVQINSGAGTTGLEIVDIQATATVAFVGATTVATAAGIALGVTALTGTADTLNLSLTSAATAGLVVLLGTGANTGLGIETIAIANNNNSAIGDMVLNLRGATTTALTISGSQAGVFDIRSATTALTNINASSSSGNLTISLTALGADATGTYTLGGGNDTIAFSAGALGSGDVINGGAGTDTLRITQTSATFQGTAINTTAVEVIRFDGIGDGNATLNVSAISTQVTALAFTLAGNAGSGSFDVAGIGSNIATLNVVDIDNNNTARFSFTAATAAVTLNIGGASAVAGSGITLDGTTGQLTIAQAGTAAVTVADVNGSNAASAAINATGTAAMTLGTASFANASSVVVNALGAGTLTLSLSAVHASAVEFNVTANLTAGGLAAQSIVASSAQTITVDAGTTAGAITFSSINAGTALNDVNITTLGASVTVSSLGVSAAGTNVWSATIAAGGGTANTVTLNVDFSSAAVQTGIVFNLSGSANIVLSAVDNSSAGASIQINGSGLVGSGNLTVGFSAQLSTAFVVSATLGSSVGTANVIDLGAGNDVINATAGGLYKVIGRGGSDTVTFGTAQTGQHFVIVGAATGAGAAAISSANGGTDTVVLGSGDYVLVTAYQTGGTLEGAAINTANFTWLNELLGGTATAGARTSTFIGDASALSGAATGTHFAIYSAAGDTIIEVLTVTATGIAGATGNVYTLTLDNQQLAGNISGTFTFSLGSAGLAITLV